MTTNRHARLVPKAAFLALFGLLPTGPGVLAALRSGARPPAKPRPAPARKAPAAAPAPEQASIPLPPVKETWIDALTPLEGGPGVLVGEPVPVGTDAATAEFGAGCGRWLHLIVGGHGELGKTPPWSDVLLIRDELLKRDLRLGADDLGKLSRRLGLSLGLTHVALGEIRGNAERCTLTYRLWEVPARKAVGEAQTVEGSEAEVVAALPRIAAGLCAALGIAAPRVPEAVAESAADLRALGSLEWVPSQGSRSLTLEQLARMAVRIYGSGGAGKPPAPVLTAFLAMLHQGVQKDPAQILSLGKAAIRALPENVLLCTEVVAQAAHTGRAGPSDMPRPELKKLREQFPNNYPLRIADCFVLQVSRRPDEARKAAEGVVRCAVRNPDAWLFLHQGIFAQADHVRHARTIGAMTPEELEYCVKRYEEQLPVASQVVRMDPEYFRGWEALCQSAAFSGESDLADMAYWKALALARGRYEIYWWGLQLYQPKWLGDFEKLARVARLAADAAKDWDSATRVQVAFAVHAAGLAALAEPVVRTDQERAALKERIEDFEKLQEGAP